MEPEYIDILQGQPEFLPGVTWRTLWLLMDGNVPQVPLVTRVRALNIDEKIAELREAADEGRQVLLRFRDQELQVQEYPVLMWFKDWTCVEYDDVLVLYVAVTHPLWGGIEFG